MTAYWLYNGAWLAALSRMSNEPRTPATPVGLIGCAGALALILYVTFLGTQEPFYEFMRRFGIYFYFLFTIVAQLLLARRTIGLSRTLNLPSTLATGRLQFALAVIPFGLSALNLVLKNVLPEADTAEKVIEWIVALLMHCFFVASYFAWRETGYRADLTVTAKHR